MIKRCLIYGCVGLVTLLLLGWEYQCGQVADYVTILGLAVTLVTMLEVLFINDRIVELKRFHWFELHLKNRISTLQKQVDILYDNVPVDSENTNNVLIVSNKCLKICQEIRSKHIRHNQEEYDVNDLNDLLDQTIKCCQNIQNTSKGESRLADDHIKKLTSSLAQLIENLKGYRNYLKKVSK